LKKNLFSPLNPNVTINFIEIQHYIPGGGINGGKFGGPPPGAPAPGGKNGGTPGGTPPGGNPNGGGTSCCPECCISLLSFNFPFVASYLTMAFDSDGFSFDSF
jgi:hypothetical protein